MAVNFQVHNGKCAIYTGTDHLPFDDPLGYVSRVLFHSDLEHPSIVQTITGSTAFPARNIGDATMTQVHAVHAHGLGVVPYCEGKITSGLSQVVTLAGSVPVNGAGLGLMRWITLGADATYIYLNDHFGGATGMGGTASASLPAITLGWTIYITDKAL